MPIVGTPITPSSGDYFNARESAELFGGQYNANAWADKGDSDGQDIAAINETWEQSLIRGSGPIRLAWRSRLKTAGVDYTALSDLTLDGDEETWLAETADWGTILALYAGWGAHDVGSDIDGKMAQLRERYEARLAQIRSGDVLLVAQEDAGVEDTDATDVGAFQSLTITRVTCDDDEYAQ